MNEREQFIARQTALFDQMDVLLIADLRKARRRARISAAWAAAAIVAGWVSISASIAAIDADPGPASTWRFVLIGAMGFLVMLASVQLAAAVRGHHSAGDVLDVVTDHRHDPMSHMHGIDTPADIGEWVDHDGPDAA